MYPDQVARELGVLLRISRELDVVGDVTAIVDNPSELLVWANTLNDVELTAWRATDSGSRYLQVSAPHHHAPIRGRVTAILHCDHHLEFWRELVDTGDLNAGDRIPVALTDLAKAWETMPLRPPA